MDRIGSHHNVCHNSRMGGLPNAYESFGANTEYNFNFREPLPMRQWYGNNETLSSTRRGGAASSARQQDSLFKKPLPPKRQNVSTISKQRQPINCRTAEQPANDQLREGGFVFKKPLQPDLRISSFKKYMMNTFADLLDEQLFWWDTDRIKHHFNDYKQLVNEEIIQTMRRSRNGVPYGNNGNSSVFNNGGYYNPYHMEHPMAMNNARQSFQTGTTRSTNNFNDDSASYDEEVNDHSIDDDEEVNDNSIGDDEEDVVERFNDTVALRTRAATSDRFKDSTISVKKKKVATTVAKKQNQNSKNNAASIPKKNPKHSILAAAKKLNQKSKKTSPARRIKRQSVAKLTVGRNANTQDAKLRGVIGGRIATHEKRKSIAPKRKIAQVAKSKISQMIKEENELPNSSEETSTKALKGFNKKELKLSAERSKMTKENIGLIANTKMDNISASSTPNFKSSSKSRPKNQLNDEQDSIETEEQNSNEIEIQNDDGDQSSDPASEVSDFHELSMF